MTNAELAILSLIVERPCYGYQIEQVIEERGMRDWTEIGFSSIYYILRKLEKEDLIKSRTVPAEGKGPNRKVYQATQEGQQAWYTAALESLTTLAPRHSPFLIGLSVLPAFTQDEALSSLHIYREKLIQHRDHVRGRWKAQAADAPLPDHVDAMFEYSITLLEAELNWIDSYIHRLEN